MTTEEAIKAHEATMNRSYKSSHAYKLAEISLQALRELSLCHDAIDRYLELCSQSGSEPICDCGGDPKSELSDRPCVRENGGLCHWCELEAAREGIDRRKIEATYERQANPSQAAIAAADGMK